MVEAAVSEQRIEELYVLRTPDECRAHVERFRQADLQLLVVAVPPTSSIIGEEFSRLIETFS